MTDKKNTPAKRPFSQDFSGPSMTDQSQRREADVNYIIKKYVQTGIDPMPGTTPQNFGFASSKTYSEVAREMAEVNSAFAALPSGQRAYFSNDPGEWLEHQARTLIEEPEIVPPEASQEASSPPPEDTAPGESGEKVQ